MQTEFPKCKSFTFIKMISGVFLCENETRVLTHISFMSHRLSVCLTLSTWSTAKLSVTWWACWLNVILTLSDCPTYFLTVWNYVIRDEFVFVTDFQHTLMFLYLILSPCEKHITHKIHCHTFLFWVRLHRNPTWATYLFCFCSAKSEFRFRS